MNRNDKIKEAFDQVHVENTLKDKTKDFIFQKTKGYKQTRFIGSCMYSLSICWGTMAIFYPYCGNQYRYQSINRIRCESF